MLAVAKGHAGEILCFDFDDSNVVILVAANVDRVQRVAVIEGDLDGAGILHHVVVGDDIAVFGQNKAGAGGSGFRDLTENIGAAGDGGVDGDHAVDSGGVDLGVGHELVSIHRVHHHFGAGALRDIHLGGDGVVSGNAPDNTAANCAAKQGTAKSQSNGFQPGTLFAGLDLGNGGADGRRLTGVIVRVAGVVTLTRFVAAGGVGIMIEVLVVVGIVVHKVLLILCRFALYMIKHNSRMCQNYEKDLHKI